MRAPIVPEITPIELDSAMKSENPPLVLDVREPEERKIVHLSDHLHIPLMELNDQSTLELITRLQEAQIKEEGLRAFFKGVLPNLILVTNPIINFVVYESLKKQILRTT